MPPEGRFYWKDSKDHMNAQGYFGVSHLAYRQLSCRKKSGTRNSLIETMRPAFKALSSSMLTE